MSGDKNVVLRRALFPAWFAKYPVLPEAVARLKEECGFSTEPYKHQAANLNRKCLKVGREST